MHVPFSKRETHQARRTSSISTHKRNPGDARALQMRAFSWDAFHSAIRISIELHLDSRAPRRSLAQKTRSLLALGTQTLINKQIHPTTWARRRRSAIPTTILIETRAREG